MVSSLYRTYALLTDNKYLKHLLKNEQNEDPFLATVASIDPFLVVDRQKAKCVIYAVLSGVGVHSLSKVLNTGVDEATQFKSKLLERCELCPINISDRTYLGKRRVPYEDSSLQVQSTSAEIVKTGIVNVSQQIPELTLVYCVYDEVVYQCHTMKVYEYAERLRQAMEQTYEGVKFTVKIRAGPSWGDLEHINTAEPL